ncbi:MAG: DUF3784 domain-containing protein [Bacteroidales bacterium]|nr:DUF3784 domain-containing protein [Bacteroidales bacterium]
MSNKKHRKQMPFVTILCSIVLVCLGFIIAFGEGDSLIPGINELDKENRRIYNAKRLRIVFFVLLFLVAVVLIISDIIDDYLLLALAVSVLTVIACFTATIWCRNK